mgnify:CR=1 FL=1
MALRLKAALGTGVILENIARAYGVSEAQAGLMNSPGHVVPRERLSAEVFDYDDLVAPLPTNPTWSRNATLVPPPTTARMAPCATAAKRSPSSSACRSPRSTRW